MRSNNKIRDIHSLLRNSYVIIYPRGLEIGITGGARYRQNHIA